MAGVTIILNCSISLPTGVVGTPIFEWMGPGASTKNTHSEGNMFSILTLNEIRPSRAGLYTCTIKFGGFISTSTNVTVSGMCVAKCQSFSMRNSFPSVEMPIPSISYTTLLAGATSVLACNYSLSGFTFRPNVVWTVDGNAVVTSGNERISTTGVSLMFSPLTTSDTGMYACAVNITSQTPFVKLLGDIKMDTLNIIVQSKSKFFCFFP